MFENAIYISNTILLIACIAGYLFTWKYRKYFNISDKTAITVILIQNTSLILGGKLLQAFVAGIPMQYVEFIYIGILGSGAFLVAMLALMLFSKLTKTSFLEIIKLCTPSYFLLFSIAKIACFLQGCCRGMVYDGILSVKYIDNLSVSYFPIQIVESILFFIIFAIYSYVIKRNKYSNQTFYLITIIAMLVKGICDSFRITHVDKVISSSQVISILIIIILVILYFKEKHKQ